MRFCFAHLQWCYNIWVSSLLIVVDTDVLHVCIFYWIDLISLEHKMTKFTPMTDLMAFNFLLCLAGNKGCPYLHVPCEWIFLTQFWSADRKAFIKRSNQLKKILANRDK